MIEFIQECRQEWKRLGVPDPIANEMAADLTADIEEAEAEGGSAEDVLGTSLFDPRRFAAAWAGARGVTAPAEPIDPITPVGQQRQRWYRPAGVIALAVIGFLVTLAAATLVVGRRSSAVAATTHQILSGPGRHTDLRAWLGPVSDLPSRPWYRRAEHRPRRPRGLCPAAGRRRDPRRGRSVLVPLVSPPVQATTRVT